MKNRIFLIITLVCFLNCKMSFAEGDGVTPEFKSKMIKAHNALVRNFKNLSTRVDNLENRVNNLEGNGGKKGTGSKSETVDLDTLTDSPDPSKVNPHHIAPGGAPNFKVLFDFLFTYHPGFEPLSFNSFHNLLMFEIVPIPEFQFSFDVSTAPRFFEADYNPSSKFQVRWGKIWIPFDDMAPHNIFGGKVNVSTMASSPESIFLPNLWTDLGVGLKWIPIDLGDFTLQTHAYLVNGFRDGGKDPLGVAKEYPSFKDLPTTADNNKDKSFGGRVHALLFRKLGIGASLFNGRWNSEDTENAKRVQMLGIDGQLRFSSTEFRTGYADMAVQTDNSAFFRRGGVYFEIGQKFGFEDRFKLLLRGGQIQLDNRVLDAGDQKLAGLKFLYNLGMVEFSAEYSRDFEVRKDKLGYHYGALRVVTAF